MTASETIPDKLLEWYDRNARSLPWRVSQGEADPYRVWLSEVMLQQTTTAAVAPYFTAFTERWPTVEALAAAPEEEVMASWAGLGYYSRARNLVACAREVAARGGFPESEEELRKLPGLGAYTAAAVAAIAFGKRAVVVGRSDIVGKPVAMMDLGAGVCTPRDPRCLLCPVSSDCRGRAQGDPARLPVKAPKKLRPQRIGTAFWIEREGQVWLVRRPGKGMLGGMRALPDDGWSVRADGSGDAPLPGSWRSGGVVRHGFTHFDLELGVVAYAGSAWGELGEGEWWPVRELEDAGLPTLFAKAAQLVAAVE